MPRIGGYFISEIKIIISRKNQNISVVENEYNITITQYLIRTTNFLASISSLSTDLRNDGINRTRVPVNDPELNIKYYISFLKSNRDKVKVFLDRAKEMKKHP
ncbi:MAG: hypothetical protein LIO43_04080 [Clostridiales bacterium]|nr:hypothetical protein [Clostridiales bacterium]